MTYITRPFFILVETFWTVLPLVVAVDLVAVYLLVFKERMDPRSFAFWMTLTIVLPFAGFALYLLYGCTLYSGSVFGRKLGGDREMGLLDDPRIRGADVPTEGNDALFYEYLAKASERAVDDISAAEETVHVSMYRPPSAFVPFFRASRTRFVQSGLYTASITPSSASNPERSMGCPPQSGYMPDGVVLMITCASA